ncbi:hypothetical protein K9M16_01995 [Candidatus Babeliales bacterium]|nr:hypothetical protein [Candidatus Babeliales bacterium]
MFFFISCARKQKDIFYFPQKEISIKPNKLSLPYVKQIRIKKDKTGNNIFWKTNFDKDILNTLEKNGYKFIGFNIYKLSRASIIPKKPINKKPVNNYNYLDKSVLIKKNKEEIKYKNCYVIKIVFLFDKKTVEGPISQIAFE